MMKKYCLISLFASLILPFLSGCSQGGKFEIEFTGNIPSPILNEEFDVGKYLKKDNAATYSLKVFYVDLYDYPNEKELPVNDFKFTPITADDLSLVFQASKGNETAYRTINLPVTQKGDPIDELLITSGFSGWADPGFRKELQFNPLYIKDGKTSIAAVYQGNNAYPYGGTFLALQNFRCLDYWTDKTWENAIITFWVFNNSDANLTFQLRIKDEYTGEVDLDWGQSGNIIQIAKPGVWTQVFFSLRKVGIEHTLYENESGTRKDACVIKVRYDKTPVTKPTPLYSYQFFIDGVDIVPASKYPEVDTRRPDKIDRLLYSSWAENCYQREYAYDKEHIKENCGESSIKYDFVGPTIPSGGACLSFVDPTLAVAWEDQKWDNAICTFWVFNDSNYDLEFQLFIFDSLTGFHLDWNGELAFPQFAKPHVWTQIFFSLNKIGINRLLYKGTINSVTRNDEFNIKSLWKGPENMPYSFYIDGTQIVDSTKYPDIDTKPANVEKISDGWENMIRDNGWEKGINTKDTTVFNNVSYPSISSLKTCFSGHDYINPDVVLSTQEQFLSSLPNMTKGTFTSDFKFSPNIDNHNIILAFVIEDPLQSGEWLSVEKEYELTPINDGWYHLTIDLNEDFYSSLLAVIRIGFYFVGINELNQNEAYAYLDNVFFKVN